MTPTERFELKVLQQMRDLKQEALSLQQFHTAAVLRASEQMITKNSHIKWVNDVLDKISKEVSDNQ